MKLLLSMIILGLTSCGDITSQTSNPVLGNVIALKDMTPLSSDEIKLKAELCSIMAQKKIKYQSFMVGAIFKYDSTLADCDSVSENKDISLQVDSESGQLVLNGSSEDLRYGFRYVEIIQANSSVNNLCTSLTDQERFINDGQNLKSLRLRSQGNSIIVVYGDLVAYDGGYKLMHREEIVYNTRNTSSQPLGVVLQRDVESILGCQLSQSRTKSLKFQGYSRL